MLMPFVLAKTVIILIVFWIIVFLRKQMSTGGKSHAFAVWIYFS